jgi:crotonobetainyl-CoA:carnitine CoA-transferase CaiB-like acyl-CoA transferase
MAEGALSDITVLETGQLIAGPFCGQMLGDFGATVIKAEDPRGGDPLRRWGRMKDGQSMWWPTLARNKRSVTLNLRDPRGRRWRAEMAAKADVMIENSGPGTVERWGPGVGALSTLNPAW